MGSNRRPYDYVVIAPARPDRSVASQARAATPSCCSTRERSSIRTTRTSGIQPLVRGAQDPRRSNWASPPPRRRNSTTAPFPLLQSKGGGRARSANAASMRRWRPFDLRLLGQRPGRAGWSYGDLTPLFEEIEATVGSPRPPPPCSRRRSSRPRPGSACRSTRTTTADRPSHGCVPFQFTVDDDGASPRRTTSFEKYVSAQSPPNLTVATGCTVQKLVVGQGVPAVGGPTARPVLQPTLARPAQKRPHARRPEPRDHPRALRPERPHARRPRAPRRPSRAPPRAALSTPGGPSPTPSSPTLARSAQRAERRSVLADPRALLACSDRLPRAPPHARRSGPPPGHTTSPRSRATSGPTPLARSAGRDDERTEAWPPLAPPSLARAAAAAAPPTPAGDADRRRPPLAGPRRPSRRRAGNRARAPPPRPRPPRRRRSRARTSSSSRSQPQIARSAAERLADATGGADHATTASPACGPCTSRRRARATTPTPAGRTPHLPGRPIHDQPGIRGPGSGVYTCRATASRRRCGPRPRRQDTRERTRRGL